MHADGPLLPREEWLRHEGSEGHMPSNATLPAHGLNVFVPLVDFCDEGSAAPTTFLPGTHHSTVAAAAFEAEAAEPGSSAGTGAPARLQVRAGDAIVFDVRTHHAGGANHGTQRRPLLYFCYGRPWYTAECHRRLLEDGHHVMKRPPEDGVSAVDAVRETQGTRDHDAPDSLLPRLLPAGA